MGSSFFQDDEGKTFGDLSNGGGVAGLGGWGKNLLSKGIDWSSNGLMGGLAEEQLQGEEIL